MDSFTNLIAWKRSMDLAKEVYAITRKFPQDERFGMTAQIRRSAASILANIAEGFGRFTYPDKANKYTIARGEAAETRAFILLAVALDFLPSSETIHAQALAEEVSRLLTGLIKSCRKRS